MCTPVVAKLLALYWQFSVGSSKLLAAVAAIFTVEESDFQKLGVVRQDRETGSRQAPLSRR